MAEIRTEQELLNQNNDTFRDEGSDAHKLKGKTRAAEARGFFANIIASVWAALPKVVFTQEEKDKLAGLESSHFKGTYLLLEDLQAAVPVGVAGDYADVDAAAGADVQRYIWDTTGAQWVAQVGASVTETAASVKEKYESNPDTNAFTDAEKERLGTLDDYLLKREINTYADNYLRTRPGFGTGKVLSTDGVGNIIWAVASVVPEEPEEPIPNKAPTANAGADQSITLPTNSVTLTGSGTDTDGTIASYAWSKVSGGAAAITSPNSAATTITGLVQGVYVFRLTVTDDGGLTASDEVQITVLPEPETGEDTIPPSAPGKPAFSNITTTTATVSWTPATDNVAVAGYNLYIDGVKQN